MRAFNWVLEMLQDEYMPSGPVESTGTQLLQLLDAVRSRFGKDGDTIGKCQIDAADIFWFSTDQLDALKTLSESRMGIYEHVGMDGIHVRLRELVTGDDITCLSASGYRGEVGELWYARLLPSLVPELVNYHVVFTTPYILIHSTKDDWVQFLKRSILELKGGDERQRLHRLLKYGLGTHFWNEFVFKSYHHHQADAVFLAGIPDIKATLPHA